MSVKPARGRNKQVQLAGCIQPFLDRGLYARIQFYNGKQQPPATCG